MMPLHLQIQHSYLQADYSAVMKGQVDKIIETTEHLSIRVSAVENQMRSVLVLLEGLKQIFENEYDQQNSETCDTDFSAQITSLHEKMSKLQEDMSNMIVAVQKSNEGKEAITLSRHTSPLGAGTIEILERVENISVKATELDHRLDRCLSCCLDQEVRLELLERATYNGVLLWKIDDFARRRKDAVDGVTMSLYSIPFYTSRHGYKMCAKVYLNGDGIGKGTYLSFFLVLMRGPFDTLLPWPFKQKVLLTIINHAGKKHFTDIFCPDPQSNSFQRPIQTKMNVASGLPMFIHQEQLLNGGFVKDDCIFLRVVVDTSIDDSPVPNTTLSGHQESECPAVKKHVTDTIRPDLQSNSFQSPTQKEMNVASGCPVFIRQEQLLNGGFISQDFHLCDLSIEYWGGIECLVLSQKAKRNRYGCNNGTIKICVDLKPFTECVLREVYPLLKVDDTLVQLIGAKVFSKRDANCGFWKIPL
ncbi:hypothetical protein EMCRGX_G016549 [Ephydatia muelleri]